MRTAEGVALPKGLQELVEAHLRASLMLRSVMRAEEEALANIVKALHGVPDELHESLVGRCVQRVADKYVHDP